MTPSYDDQLVVINLSLSFLFRTTIMFTLIFIYLHALHFVINVMFFAYIFFAHSWLGCFIYLMMYASVFMLTLHRAL
jgi:hypothetical protein